MIDTPLPVYWLTPLSFLGFKSLTENQLFDLGNRYTTQDIPYPNIRRNVDLGLVSVFKNDLKIAHTRDIFKKPIKFFCKILNSIIALVAAGGWSSLVHI